MVVSAIIAILIQATLPVDPAHTMQLPWDDCVDHYGKNTAEVQIQACSEIINSYIPDENDLAVAHSNRALSYASIENYELAIIDFDRSIELNQTDHWPIYNRAISSIKLNDDNTALNYMNRAINLKPNFFEALLERGQIHLRQENLLLALSDFDRVVELSPNNSVAHAFRGIALWNQGKTREAIQAFERAQRLDPDTLGVAENLQRLRAIQEAGPRREMTTYRDCVLAAASRLERSGERADIVASAAIETCRTERATFENAAQENWDWRMARRVAEISQEELTKAAQARVVELRSRRR